MTSSESSSASAAAGAAGDDGLGRLTEEVRLLVELVVEHALPWLEQLLATGHGDSGGQSDQQGDSASASGGAACEWCPLCAVAAIARGQSPEFVVRLFEQAAQVIALLRAVLADRWQPDDGVHMPGFTPAQRPSRPSRESESERVQHISVRKAADWD